MLPKRRIRSEPEDADTRLDTCWAEESLRLCRWGDRLPGLVRWLPAVGNWGFDECLPFIVQSQRRIDLLFDLFGLFVVLTENEFKYEFSLSYWRTGFSIWAHTVTELLDELADLPMSWNSQSDCPRLGIWTSPTDHSWSRWLGWENSMRTTCLATEGDRRAPRVRMESGVSKFTNIQKAIKTHRSRVVLISTEKFVEPA